MSLISRISRAPIPFEPDHGQSILELYPDAPEPVAALLMGTAGCSPYLRGLLQREADWLQSVWTDTTENILSGIRSEVKGANFDTLAADLRRAKRHTALLVALADLGGVWTLSQVTNALTRFADFAVQTALEFLLNAEINRGKLPGVSSANDAGLCVLAMGKMGAFELNYSSDIDLIVLFDETRHADEDFEALRSGFVRITKRLCKMLSEVTRDGYVFRTDLRLRPDPSVTPVCLSMGAAERYYESLGRTWERAAFIKARACAGDISAGQAFLKVLRPFVWRKHLDFAAIEDAHDMRLRIRSHKGLGGPITLPGHNMKLGRGGIREIEFFTQTRQIIAGGRDMDLQVRGTLDGLDRLAEKGWISEETATAMAEIYTEHRTLEHRLQMIGDAQTHDLPTSAMQFQRLANFCGQDSVLVFQAEVTASLELVHNLTESFFAREHGDGDAASAPELTPALVAMIGHWQDYPALRSARAGAIFNQLQPVILHRMNRAANPAEALIQFDGFLKGLPSGVQLFSMFKANPTLIDLLVDICATAPGLARHLSQNPAVFDAVIGGDFFATLPELAGLADDLGRVVAAAADYEAQLNGTRRWVKEMRFRIGVLHLRGMISAVQAGRHYSDLAQACLQILFDPIAVEFGRRHGPMPGRGAMVLGMGSLGAQSLTANSDLDLIVIYDGDGVENSSGKRPLPVSTYYARFTQSLVTALSSPMAEGRLFEVDMRLRPSGRKGPVATPLSGFKQYQQAEAWTWEHLALTRARGVAGDAELSADVEAFRQQLLAGKVDPSEVLRDVQDMRRRLAAAAGGETDNPWNAKAGPGAMQDIELLAQAAAYVAGSALRDVISQLQQAEALGWVDAAGLAQLTEAYLLQQVLHQAARLIGENPPDPAAIGQGAQEFLLRETGVSTMSELAKRLSTHRLTAAKIIAAVLGR